MRTTVGAFAAKVARAGSDTVALVYYAGHGVQIDGENFLVPVDVRISREADVPLQAFRLADLMNTLSSVPSAMRIVMLDACRNNPFSEINKTAGRGLAIVDAPVGSIVSYSTSPGAEAEDGTARTVPIRRRCCGSLPSRDCRSSRRSSGHVFQSTRRHRAGKLRGKVPR